MQTAETPWPRRVVGIETEYGITAVSCGSQESENGESTTGSAAIGKSQIISQFDSEAAAAALFQPLISQGISANMFLANGSRMYLDVGSHPEYATAECDNLTDLLAADRAGDVFYTQLINCANQNLQTQEKRLHLVRNNIDYAGNSYGCHENYLIYRRPDYRERLAALVPFFVTRQILCGAGYIRRSSRMGQKVEYCFSQRSEQMWDAISAASTQSRPIINTRDEPHADKQKYRRMHVVVGDTNVCEATTALKIFSTLAVLAYSEDLRRSFSDLELDSPMTAIRQINRDRECKTKLLLADGRKFSALELQTEILNRVINFFDHYGLDSEICDLSRYSLDLWQRVLNGLMLGDISGFWEEIDWAIKLRLLQRYEAKNHKAADISDLASWPQTVFSEAQMARILRLEVAYHDISAQYGLRERLEERGLMRRLTTTLEVSERLENPPSTTRAALRGAFIAACQKTGQDYQVDWQTLRIAGDGSQLAKTILLTDPLSAANEQVEKLCAQLMQN